MNKENQKLFEAIKTLKEFCEQCRCVPECPLLDEKYKCLIQGFADDWNLERIKEGLNVD